MEHGFIFCMRMTDIPGEDVAELVHREAVVLAGGEVHDQLAVERIHLALHTAQHTYAALAR